MAQREFLYHYYACAPLSIARELMQKVTRGGQGRVENVFAKRTANTEPNAACTRCKKELLIGEQVLLVITKEVEGIADEEGEGQTNGNP